MQLVPRRSFARAVPSVRRDRQTNGERNVMPISKAKRSLYPKDWKAISLRVRDAAAWKCQRCKAPGRTIARGDGDDAGTYMLGDGRVFDDETGQARGMARGSEYLVSRWVHIVLTVAHLDHDPSNNADDNLRALCQKCHLAHDKAQHAESARETRRGRKAAGNLPGIE